MDENRIRMTSGQESTINGVRRALTTRLEAAPKPVPTVKNDVKSDCRFTPKGTLVIDFTVSGTGLAPRVREADRRHRFVRLEFDMPRWGCTATICPAVIPGLKLSSSDGRKDNDTEKRLGEWGDCVRNVLRQSDLKEFEINVGMLRDASFRKNCPFQAKSQEAARQQVAAR